MRLFYILAAACMLLGVLCACTDKAAAPEKHAHAHAHVHHAAHGGTLIEVGAHQANLEVVCDREVGSMLVYICGPHAERPVRLAVEQIAINCAIGEDSFATVLQAQANALSQETIGDSATYAVTDERLKTTQPIRVTVPKLTIFGQEFKDISGLIK